MKTYLPLAILVTIIGIFLGMFYIRSVDTTPQLSVPKAKETKSIFGEKISEKNFDETEITQEEIETYNEESNIEKEGLRVEVIETNNNQFEFLLPEFCTNQSTIITCNGNTPFTIDTNPQTQNLPTDFVNSQNFLAGDYEVSINTKENQTVIYIKDKNGNTTTLLVTENSFENIAPELMQIIATFSERDLKP